MIFLKIKGKEIKNQANKKLALENGLEFIKYTKFILTFKKQQ